MKYNVPYAKARWSIQGLDWELGVDYGRLRKERLKRAQDSLKANGIGAMLCFNWDNVRYITSTHVTEGLRDKWMHYCFCPAEGDPVLFDIAIPAKKIACPWMKPENIRPVVSDMSGGLPPSFEKQTEFKDQIQNLMKEFGIEGKPLGVDHMQFTMEEALRDAGINLVDGMQAMLDAREVKTIDEIELLKISAAMMDGVYEDLARAIRPGVRENELVALAHHRLISQGAERIEFMNSCSGPRTAPHTHLDGFRMIQPGDFVFFDIGNTFNGYHTCYYRTFICGKPNKYQEEAYERASKWLSDALDVIKPGVSTADVAAVWPSAEELGLPDEATAFGLQVAHGVGLGLHERPGISRLFSFDYPDTIKEGMCIAVETFSASEDGNGGARIEEEIIVTKDGCECIFNYPSDHLISCGLPGCEVYGFGPYRA